METGSFVNYVYNRTRSTPEVGRGATICLWTDRHAYFVIDVSDDKKTCTLERPRCERVDSNGMSECQTYNFLHQPDPIRFEIRFLWGKWRRIWDDGTRQPVKVIFGTMDEYYDFSF